MSLPDVFLAQLQNHPETQPSLPIHLPASEGEAPRRGVLAINKAGAVTVLHDKVHGAQVWKMAADGKDPQLVARLAAPNKQFRTDTSYPVCRALASDGNTFLLLAEWPQLRQDGRVRMQVRGWRLGPDAKPQDDADTGFILAADERRDPTLASRGCRTARNLSGSLVRTPGS